MEKYWLLLAGLVVGSYLLGNVNFALIISKYKKSDVRTLGSGNPGTLNMSRNFGLKIGLLTLFLDMMKGAIPTLIGYFAFYGVYVGEGVPQFYFSDLAKFACGFAAVLGHIYPVFLKFKGGKGIASTIGVFLVAMSVSGAWAVVTLMSMVAAVLFIYFTEYGAMGSFIAITPPAIAESIRFFIAYKDNNKIVFYYIAANMLIFLICFFTWFAHRRNIERMLAGEEHPTSIREMLMKWKANRREKKEKKKENQFK